MARGDYISSIAISKKTKPEPRATEIKVKDVNAIKKTNTLAKDSVENCVSTAITQQLQKTYKFTKK